MTEKEKLDSLIAYIQNAEKYAFEKADYDSQNAKIERCNAIQDITSFIEHELDIELTQLTIDPEKTSEKIPDRNVEGIRKLATEIGDVPSAYLSGLNDAIMACSGIDIDFIISFRKRAGF